MFKHALGLIALIVSLSAFGSVNQSGAVFDSLEEAVVAAADSYNPVSILEDREYMGTIFRSNNRFGYTVARGAPRARSMSIRIPVENYDAVVAFWHTHGNASRSNRYFSRIDTETANRFQKSFYLADYTGYLKVYRPGYKVLSPFSARRLGLPQERGYSTGEFVKDRLNRPIRVNTRMSQLGS